MFLIPVFVPVSNLKKAGLVVVSFFAGLYATLDWWLVQQIADVPAAWGIKVMFYVGILSSALIIFYCAAALFRR